MKPQLTPDTVSKNKKETEHLLFKGLIIMQILTQPAEAGRCTTGRGWGGDDSTPATPG